MYFTWTSIDVNVFSRVTSTTEGIQGTTVCCFCECVVFEEIGFVGSIETVLGDGERIWFADSEGVYVGGLSLLEHLIRQT